MPRKTTVGADVGSPVASSPTPVISAADWFDDHPDLERTSVAEYCAAAPRGMTNPPQNPRVREKLFRDLIEYGIEHTREWPPPKPLFKEVDHDSLMTSKFVRRHPFPYGRHAIIAAEHQRSANAVVVEKRPAAIRKKWMAVDARECGRRRNASAPRLAAASSPAGAQRSVSEQAFLRPPSSASREAAALKESRAALGSRGSSDTGRPGSSSLAKTGLGKSCGSTQRTMQSKDQNIFDVAAGDDDKDGSTSNEMAEMMHRNGMDALRSRSRLHSAAVSDRHRFAGDLTATGSMVLTGAGAAGGPPAGKWTSDASDLNVFHNRAMRTVNPSGLKEKPIPVKRRKKKEEDELQLSDSGLFVARYVMDPNVRLAKTLRQRYPGGADEELPPFISVAQQKQMDAARSLADLSGFGF